MYHPHAKPIARDRDCTFMSTTNKRIENVRIGDLDDACDLAVILNLGK